MGGMRRLLTGIASGTALIVLWYGVVHIFQIPWYILPSPESVFVTFERGIYDVIAEGTPMAPQGFIKPTIETLKAAFFGFLIGTSVGITGGVLLAELPIIERLFLPYIAAFQSLPKIALVPLFMIWFGIGSASKIALSAALVFFPVLMSTLNGFHGVDPDRVALTRSYNAGGLQTVRFVTFPSALPFIFAGLELGVVYAMLGTIAAELVSGNEGIGARLMSQQSGSDVSGMFALLIITGVIGATLHLAMRRLKKKVIFWGSE